MEVAKSGPAEPGLISNTQHLVNAYCCKPQVFGLFDMQQKLHDTNGDTWSLFPPLVYFELNLVRIRGQVNSS